MQSAMPKARTETGIPTVVAPPWYGTTDSVGTGGIGTVVLCEGEPLPLPVPDAVLLYVQLGYVAFDMVYGLEADVVA